MYNSYSYDSNNYFGKQTILFCNSPIDDLMLIRYLCVWLNICFQKYIKYNKYQMFCLLNNLCHTCHIEYKLQSHNITRKAYLQSSKIDIGQISILQMPIKEPSLHGYPGYISIQCQTFHFQITIGRRLVSCNPR